MAPKAISLSIPKPLRNPLTNAEKIASANYKRDIAQKKADRPVSKKRRTLPPPDEMEAEIVAAEKATEGKKLAAERKIAIRNGKWDFSRGKPLTNAQKIVAVKKKTEARKKAKGKVIEKEKVDGESGEMGLKELVARELGFRKESAKEGEELGGGKRVKAEKNKSCFSMVMAQEDRRSPSGVAFVGVGRTLGGGSESGDVAGEEDGDQLERGIPGSHG